MVSNVKESHCDGCGRLDDFQDGVTLVRGTKSWFACDAKCLAIVSVSLAENWLPKPASLLLESSPENANGVNGAAHAAEDEVKLAELREKKGRGRPKKGSVSPERAEELRALSDAAQAETLKRVKQVSVPGAERPFQEPPRWCRCGAPVQWTGKTWECPEKHMNPLENLLPVRDGQPGENLSKLLHDAKGLGLELNLVDVAGWPVLRRDMLRSWVAGGGKDDPNFLPIEAMGGRVGPATEAPTVSAYEF
jgi:hypothetical protein